MLETISHNRITAHLPTENSHKASPPRPREATYRLVTDDTTLSRLAPLRDLTAAGMALLTTAAIEPGKLLLVVLHEGAPARFVRVRYAIPAGKGHWSVGCSFALRLTEEELVALVDDE